MTAKNQVGVECDGCGQRFEERAHVRQYLHAVSQHGAVDVVAFEAVSGCCPRCGSDDIRAKEAHHPTYCGNCGCELSPEVRRHER